MNSSIMKTLAEVEHRLSTLPVDPDINRAVLGLAMQFQRTDLSPVEDTIVLARTSLAAALGMGSALEQGNLHITDITDRGRLHDVVVTLRASADIFEAILREGTQ